MITTNLIPDQTSFVGREAELKKLEELLRDGARLVTILGTAGIGKTRLARQFAARWGAQHPVRGGVWFCDLSEARQTNQLESAIASMLHVTLETAPESREAQLEAAIAARGSVLLVLDNFEQFAGRASNTVGRWIESAPEARILVTSRQPLGLGMEVRQEIQPLSEKDASTLLVERARAVRGTVNLSAEDKVRVLEIVKRIDCLPLAIELASGRTSIFSFAVLLERLSDRFGLLRSRFHDHASRHVALETAIDWSWDLLRPVEKNALAQCSIFRGGFFVEAAESTIDVSSDPESPPVFEVLQELRERSLVRTYEVGRTRELRFGLFESIREYAARELELSGHVPETKRRYAAYYLRQAEAWSRRVRGPEEELAREQVGLELDNLALAHGYLEKPNEIVRFALALDPLLVTQGPYDVHLGLLDTALVAATAHGLADERTRLFCARGEARRLGGLLEGAKADLEEAVLMAASSTHSSLEVQARTSLACLTRDQGHLEQARCELEAALVVARGSDDKHVVARILGELGRVARAPHYLSEAIALAEITRDRRMKTVLLGYLGILAYEAGDVEDSLAHLQEALTLARATLDHRREAMIIGYIGTCLMTAGRMKEALEHLVRAVHVHREAGNTRTEAIMLVHHAIVEHGRDRFAEAEALVRESLVLVFRRGGSPWVESFAHAHLAAIHARQERSKPAREAMTRARRSGEGLGGPDFAVMLDTLDAIVALSEAREARGRADLAKAERLYESAQQKLVAATAPDVLFKTAELRVAAHLLAEAVRVYPERRTPVTLLQDTIEVADGGAWFRNKGRERVELGRRKALSRIVDRLAEGRASTPGDAISQADLVAHGWPDERMIGNAGANRLHNAMATLRQLGLKEILLTRSDGYLFDPRVDVQRVRS